MGRLSSLSLTFILIPLVLYILILRCHRWERLIVIEIPNMAMDSYLESGQSPECEQSLAYSLLIELLAYVQDLRKLDDAQ